MQAFNGSGLSIFWTPLKTVFFRDCGVSSVLESPFTPCKLRFSARCFLTLTKKSKFLEVPFYLIACLVGEAIAANANEGKSIVDERIVEENDWQQEYVVSTDTPRLFISNLWGNISVRAGLAGKISVAVGEYREAPDRIQFERWQKLVTLDIEADSNGVSMIVGDALNQWRWGDRDFCKSCRVKFQFDVTVPVGALVEVSTVLEGHIEVTGINGAVSAKNVNGPVVVNELHDCRTIDNINGIVELNFARNPDVDCEISTINGDINITMPVDGALDVATRINNGDIRSAFEIDPIALPVKVEQSDDHGRHRYRIEQAAGFRIGTGGPTFSVASMNGDLHIKQKR